MPKSSHRLFLVRCYHQNKGLFLLVILFLLLAAYGHRTRVEITPFFIFGMYSDKLQVKQDSFLTVKVFEESGKPGEAADTGRMLNLWHTFDEPRRMMIFSTLYGYHQGALRGFRDPHAQDVETLLEKHPFLSAPGRFACPSRQDYLDYPQWLLRYLRSAVSSKIERASIYMNYLHYDIHNLPVPDSTKLLYEFQ